MANPSASDIEIIRRAINERHLEQLRDLDLTGDHLENAPCASYENLVQWTNDSEDHISKGCSNRVYGGPIGTPLDFDNAFLAFMESAAMYLRDTSKVLQAVEMYRSGSNADAHRLLEESTAQIDKLAAMWGMHFIQICDFVQRHPDGHRFIVGPFCGAFFLNVGMAPFIGIAFKGTNVTREILNDLMAASTLRPSGRLWETEVAKGFYYPLFSTYNQEPTKLPFLMIQKAVQAIVIKARTSVITHVTGHSLGAGYASLTYGQLCIEGYGTPIAALGDMYTFGSPRVGRGDFAARVKAVSSLIPPASNGSTWRIVNNKDYVAKVPASPVWPISRDPFIHLDSAYTIYPGQKPSALPSEIGTHPTWSFPTAISPHYTTEYYKSLTYAMTNGPPTHSVLLLGDYPVAVFTIPPSLTGIKSLTWDCNVTPQISLERTQHSTIVGTIQYDGFVGEITAAGFIDKKIYSNPAFSYNSAQSWKALYKKENQCVFIKKSSALEILFIVDGTQVAWASVSGDGYSITSADVSRGSCVWTFAETQKITDVANQIIESAASILT